MEMMVYFIAENSGMLPENSKRKKELSW